MGQVGRAPRWNHNIHYHRVILDAAPPNCGRALDVGCGEGTLTRDLCRVADHVTGIDLHAPSIARARGQGEAPIEYVLGDFLEVFDVARRVLPGVRTRRLLLWRHALVWTRPAN